jgi:hypothetical protein
MLSLKSLPLLLAAAAMALLTSCSSGPSTVPTHPLGAKAQVGKFVYSVLEAEWRGEAPGAKQPPANRVLQLTIAVTNSASGELSIPALRLIGANGTEYPEIMEIEGNPHWFGLLRRLQPSLTETAQIFFDVPVSAYRLQVVDNTDPENEKTAFIEIPASLAPPADIQPK